MSQIDRALSSDVIQEEAGSAVVAPTSAEQILPHLSIEPPRVWDWVFTCFENITAVTGGIGTYHRLLLADLAATNRNLLILTRRCNAGVELPANATLVFIDDLKPAKSFNYVGDEHDQFSLGCHFAFRSLFRAGHRFRFVEFSDYGVDGYYPLRGRACGSYDLGHAVVRLHSPDVMLIEDNGKSYADLSSFHRDRIDREMSAYEDCDTILYGGESMRIRVEDLCGKFGLQVGHKMRKCPHPYPLDSFESPPSDAAVAEDRDFTIAKVLKSNRFAKEQDLREGTLVGIFGRIEDRKGQYQMIWAALHDPAFAEYLRNSTIHFVIAGHNVLDAIGNYSLNNLYSLIHSRKLQHRFHFTGRVPQGDLARFSSACAAFIYPSVFENYPNALLEVLCTCKPVAVSSHGCMPEITEGFRGVQVIDFQSFEPDQLRQFLDQVVGTGGEDRRAEFETRCAVVRERHARMLDIYKAEWPVAAVREPAPATVGFVIPIYEDHRFLAHTLDAVRKCLRPGDQVVVVDDASGPTAAAEIEAICLGADVPLLRLPKNLGPAGARKRGVESLSTDLVQFCDGDDMLDPEGVALARVALGRDPDLAMVTGVMSCFQEANHCWVPRNGNIWTATLANYAHSGSMGRRAAMHASLPDIRLPLNEDWLTNLRIVAAGAKCRMIPEITYHYRRFEGTRSTRNHTEVGRVHLQIIQDAMRQLTFASPQQNARLKVLLTGGTSGEGGIGLGSVVRDATPLRYQVIDAVYLRATQSRLGNAALVRARNLYLRVRKRRRPS